MKIKCSCACCKAAFSLQQQGSNLRDQAFLARRSQAVRPPSRPTAQVRQPSRNTFPWLRDQCGLTCPPIPTALAARTRPHAHPHCNSAPDRCVRGRAARELLCAPHPAHWFICEPFVDGEPPHDHPWKRASRPTVTWRSRSSAAADLLQQARGPQGAQWSIRATCNQRSPIASKWCVRRRAKRTNASLESSYSSRNCPSSRARTKRSTSTYFSSAGNSLHAFRPWQRPSLQERIGNGANMDTSAPAKFGMDAPTKMMPHTSSNTNHAALRAHIVSPCEPGRPMNTEQTQALRPLQKRCDVLRHRHWCCDRRRSWARRPHAYLAPLLTDECRSTVGPKEWEPQQCVLTCVS